MERDPFDFTNGTYGRSGDPDGGDLVHFNGAPPPPPTAGAPQLALAPVDTAATAKREDSTAQVLAPEKQNVPATPLASYFETKRRIQRGENVPAIPAETAPQPVADGTGNLLQVIPVRIEKLLVSDAAMVLQKAFNVSIELSPVAQETVERNHDHAGIPRPLK